MSRHALVKVAINGDKVLSTAKTADYLQSETVVDKTIPANEIVAFLAARGTTGQLVIYVSQGSIDKIAVLERTRATERQSEKMREILKWNCDEPQR